MSGFGPSLPPTPLQERSRPPSRVNLVRPRTDRRTSGRTRRTRTTTAVVDHHREAPAEMAGDRGAAAKEGEEWDEKDWVWQKSHILLKSWRHLKTQ